MEMQRLSLLFSLLLGSVIEMERFFNAWARGWEQDCALKRESGVADATLWGGEWARLLLRSWDKGTAITGISP